MFQSFARLADLQRLKNVKVDPMSVKVGHPWVKALIWESSDLKSTKQPSNWKSEQHFLQTINNDANKSYL